MEYYIKNIDGIFTVDVEKLEDSFVAELDDDYPIELYLSNINKVEQEISVVKAKEYLATTDWYYIRQLETSEEVPTEVSAKREEARAYIRGVQDV